MATYDGAMERLSDDLAARGLIHQSTDPDLAATLDGGGVTFYIGFDPTADSLHLGNLLQLCTMRRLQLAGHRPIALAGGGTGMIGDPGGRSEERNLLDDAQLAVNLEGIKAQLGRFLDFTDAAGPTQALLLDNGAWLRSLSMIEFLRDTGKHFTVNEMVAKDSVRSRFERPDQGISYTEFNYMLLQAYDFLQLHLEHGCALQLGGSDQWGNITMGTSLVRKVTGNIVHAMTLPLVLKADGTKFGKSVGGAVWLDRTKTSPYELYQFLINVEDEMVGTYLRYFSFRQVAEIEALEAAQLEDPGARVAHKALAAEVVQLVHGADDAARAEAASQALFAGSLASLDGTSLAQVSSEVGTTSIARAELEAGLALLEVLASTGLVASKGEARRAVDQGGVSVNDVKVTSIDATITEGDLIDERFVVLRKGKRQYHLLEVR